MAGDQKGAEEQRALLIFVDESGFSLRPSVRRTWTPKGQTPVIVHRFNWERVHSLGALVCEADGSNPNLLLHFQEHSIKEDTILAFLKGLKEGFDRNVVVLWDGLRAHWSKAVKRYVEAEREWLTVERFPSYAPELNPVEYVWSPLKGKHTANLCPDNAAELKEHLKNTWDELISAQNMLTGCLKASGLFPDLL